LNVNTFFKKNKKFFCQERNMAKKSRKPCGYEGFCKIKFLQFTRFSLKLFILGRKKSGKTLQKG